MSLLRSDSDSAPLHSAADDPGNLPGFAVPSLDPAVALSAGSEINQVASRRSYLSSMFLAGLQTQSPVPAQGFADLSGVDDEERRCRAIAHSLGLPFVTRVDPDALILRDRDLDAVLRNPNHRMAIADGGGGDTTVIFAPGEADLPKLRRLMLSKPGMALRLRITSGRRLRDAVLERAAPHILRNARDGLFDRYPQLSARIVVNAWQGAVVGAGIVVLPAALLVAPGPTTLALHAFFSLLFFSCVFVRLAAARRVSQMRLAPLTRVREADLPVYTVLVALYREAEVVPDLLVALGRIIWPRSKLEIKLICEADDEATLAALAAQTLRPSVEVVRVPPGGPRTKPKALAYALQLVSGEFVALYDAEDRPHPLQLVEAWQRFNKAGPDLACVQAPLVVSNWNRGLLERMFAFEYAGLFRGLLPWLSRRGLMFPLGGTSNHFRGVM